MIAPGRYQENKLLSCFLMQVTVVIPMLGALLVQAPLPVEVNLFDGLVILYGAVLSADWPP